MKTIYIINGFPRSGKDTFMDRCVLQFSECGFITKKHSTVDTVKTIATLMGWNGEKTTENREMLSELKDFYTKYFDGPLKEIQNLMLDTPVDILFVAMREPEEIRKTCEWGNLVGIKVRPILIRGTREERDHNSHSDIKVLDFDYGLVFNNDSSIEDFHKKIDSFVDYMIK